MPRPIGSTGFMVAVLFVGSHAWAQQHVFDGSAPRGTDHPGSVTRGTPAHGQPIHGTGYGNVSSGSHAAHFWIQDPAVNDEDASAKPAEQPSPPEEPQPDAAASAHKDPFYNNDFTYLLSDEQVRWYFGDRFKRRCFGLGVLDLGGQLRLRGHHERNHRGLGLTGLDDDFLLQRLRLYGNWEISPNLRFYGETLDARSFFHTHPPRGTEVNHFDMQNLFIDVRVLDACAGDLWVRTGRQELLFGVQRLISPLDWGNTRRTFEGVRLMWQGAHWDIDAFWTHPVRIDPRRFDSPDRDQEFMGLYATNKSYENAVFDWYLLRHHSGRGADNFSFNTAGTRWEIGEIFCTPWTFETEAAYQFGTNNDGSNHVAGMATVGLGRPLKTLPWSPKVTGYYDWASGGTVLGGTQGFHHHFPLAHRYMGWMDLFGRSNIQDFNVLLSLEPTERLNVMFWYHYFLLSTSNDTPYTVGMTPFNPGNAPASPELGHELDLLAVLTLNARMKLGLGYSRFFAGRYYRETAGVPHRGDADFFYTEFIWNF